MGIGFAGLTADSLLASLGLRVKLHRVARQCSCSEMVKGPEHAWKVLRDLRGIEDLVICHRLISGNGGSSNGVQVIGNGNKPG